MRFNLLVSLWLITLLLGGGALCVQTSMPAMDVFTDSVHICCIWLWTAWFGYFADLQSGWIYHPQYGFLYCSGNAATGVWVYDYDDGAWMWTSSSIFPCCFRMSGGSGEWTAFGSTGTSHYMWGGSDS